MFLSMLPSTEGNAVSAFTLGSQFIWSTACPRASPLKSGCACTHRSASTTCSGNVAAERIYATSESGYNAIRRHQLLKLFGSFRCVFRASCCRRSCLLVLRQHRRLWQGGEDQRERQEP